MEPKPSPRTRCGCSDPDCPGSLRGLTDGPFEPCRDVAVRVVYFGWNANCPTLPMCEACAAWYDSKPDRP